MSINPHSRPASPRCPLRRRGRKPSVGWALPTAWLGGRCPPYILLIAIIGNVAHAQPATAPSGLDALSDDRLMTELASRGLTTLLDRAFEINHVPKFEQEGRRSLLALQQLSDATTKLTARQRQD